jgi:hypothetical protein
MPAGCCEAGRQCQGAAAPPSLPGEGRHGLHASPPLPSAPPSLLARLAHCPCKMWSGESCRGRTRAGWTGPAQHSKRLRGAGHPRQPPGSGTGTARAARAVPSLRRDGRRTVSVTGIPGFLSHWNCVATGQQAFLAESEIGRGSRASCPQGGRAARSPSAMASAKDALRASLLSTSSSSGSKEPDGVLTPTPDTPGEYRSSKQSLDCVPTTSTYLEDDDGEAGPGPGAPPPAAVCSPRTPCPRS